MPANPYESPSAVGYRKGRSRRLPGWVVGALAGVGLWLLAAVAGTGFEWLNQWIAVGFLATVCQVLAAPISLGGWLLIWGDNGPPFRWLESVPVNVGVTVGGYGLAGGLVGRFLSRRRGRSSDSRTGRD